MHAPETPSQAPRSRHHHEPRPIPARVGILGGIGPAATGLYYELLVGGGRQRGPGLEVVIFSLDFERFTWLEDHDRPGYVREIRRGLGVLAASGAGVVALAANSPHAVLDEVAGSGPKLVDIVGSVGRAARAEGVRRALLVGIPATMTAGFYAAALERHGVEVRVPHARHHERIRSIVFDELTHGIRSPVSRDWMVGLTAGHAVDALVLACTELSLLIGAGDAPVKVLDSTRLHVADILDAAWATNGGDR